MHNLSVAELGLLTTSLVPEATLADLPTRIGQVAPKATVARKPLVLGERGVSLGVSLGVSRELEARAQPGLPWTCGLRAGVARVHQQPQVERPTRI